MCAHQMAALFYKKWRHVPIISEIRLCLSTKNNTDISFRSDESMEPKAFVKKSLQLEQQQQEQDE